MVLQLRTGSGLLCAGQAPRHHPAPTQALVRARPPSTPADPSTEPLGYGEVSVLKQGKIREGISKCQYIPYTELQSCNNSVWWHSAPP